ncbi:uncharacterized protein LOC130385514 [Gadus chalcogrammus]|uniref:uncharacterized protein LOC130385514 n=1 Tax=Gadus chalcogrammus TaxID=1042646 RepID=UPI0024C29C3C|nr:uncharacterized protein LOC130385514 [Gadus chalcogrammus]
MELQVCLLEGNKEHVPKDEIVLLQAGLGRRTVNICENADHEDISRALQEEYPKMRGLCGGRLLKKGAGGSGKRKITSLPQGTQGYTGKILKTSSNSGKYVLYIVPLQESLDLRPLAHTAVEFHKMPKHPCMACRSEIPLPLLPHHIKLCNKDEPDLIDDDDEDDAEDTAAAKDVNDDVIAMQSCPICGQDFAVDYLPTHAAWCDESLNSRTELKECRTELKECRTELKECRTDLKEWMMVPGGTLLMLVWRLIISDRHFWCPKKTSKI